MSLKAVSIIDIQSIYNEIFQSAFTNIEICLTMEPRGGIVEGYDNLQALLFLSEAWQEMLARHHHVDPDRLKESLIVLEGHP